ncbi:MAG: DsbA family protein [Actinomycetes bacterium]
MSNAANRREQLRQQQLAQAAQARVRRMIAIGAGIVALALVAVMVFVFVQQSGTRAGGTPPNASADGSTLIVNKGKAKEGAKKVILYLDYQCPNCRHFEEYYGSALQSLADGGDIDYQVNVMTFMDQNLSNTGSTWAAVAATCTDEYGKFAQATQTIYGQQEQQEVRGSQGYTDDFLKDQLPTTLGLTGDQVTAYQQCYTSRATKGFLETMSRAAYSAGVNSTPTLTVNGKKVDIPQIGGDVNAFKQLVLGA